MLTKHVGGPDAELGAALGVDPVADGYDGVEIVELDIADNGTPSLGLNCCIFCNSCVPIQLAFLVYVSQVLGDERLVAPKEGRQLVQRQPDRIPLKLDIQPDSSVGARIQHQF